MQTRVLRFSNPLPLNTPSDETSSICVLFITEMVFDRALPILKRVGRSVVRGGKSAYRLTASGSLKYPALTRLIGGNNLHAAWTVKQNFLYESPPRFCRLCSTNTNSFYNSQCHRNLLLYRYLFDDLGILSFLRSNHKLLCVAVSTACQTRSNLMLFTPPWYCRLSTSSYNACSRLLSVFLKHFPGYSFARFKRYWLRRLGRFLRSVASSFSRHFAFRNSSRHYLIRKFLIPQVNLYASILLVLASEVQKRDRCSDSWHSSVCKNPLLYWKGSNINLGQSSLTVWSDYSLSSLLSSSTNKWWRQASLNLNQSRYWSTPRHMLSSESCWTKISSNFWFQYFLPPTWCSWERQYTNQGGRG